MGCRGVAAPQEEGGKDRIWKGPALHGQRFVTTASGPSWHWQIVINQESQHVRQRYLDKQTPLKIR